MGTPNLWLVGQKHRSPDPALAFEVGGRSCGAEPPHRPASPALCGGTPRTRRRGRRTRGRPTLCGGSGRRSGRTLARSTRRFHPGQGMGPGLAGVPHRV